MKHWVFDLDGTLVDSFSHYFAALHEIFEKHGAEFSKDHHYTVLTDPLADFLTLHLGEHALGTAFTQLQTRSNADALKIQPFTHTFDTFKHLAEQNARIAIWTSRDLTSTQIILKQTGLDQYVEDCVSGTCVTDRKPHPEGLLRIIKRFGCKPDGVTMVGDHDHDVNAAKKVGARAVRASWHGYWPVKKCTHADHHFHDMGEFFQWVQKSTK